MVTTRIIKEQRIVISHNKTPIQCATKGMRMNAPSYNGNGNGGPVNTRSGPGGQTPSESFNTYDPKGTAVMPFMSDMGGNRSGNFSY